MVHSLRSFVWYTCLTLVALYIVQGVSLWARGDCYVPTHRAHYDSHYYDFQPVVFFQFVGVPTTPPPVAFVPSTQGLSQADRAAIAAEVVRQLRGTNGQAPTTTVAPPAAKASGPTTNPGELILRGAQIVTTRCAECHTEPGRGKVSIFDQSGAFTGRVSWRRIYQAVADDSMPKNPNKLSADEKGVLRTLAGVKE